MSLRVIVTGSRYYANQALVFNELNALAAKHGRLTVIEGGATGADALARLWAKSYGHELVTMPADWNAHGNHAGNVRNEMMIVLGKPDLVLAFHGGTGTADMRQRAAAHRIPIKHGGESHDPEI